MHGGGCVCVSSTPVIIRPRGSESRCSTEPSTQDGQELARQPLQGQGGSELEGMECRVRSAERPWDGEGVAGNGVMVWVEGGGAGRGGDGEEEGGMSGGDGMEMLGSQCTAERAGRSTVALVTIIEIIREIILEVINLFYIIFTIPWVGAIIIIPVLEIETPRHRKIKQLARFSPGLKAQASRCTAHPHLPYHTATQTEGALGPGA